MFDFNTTVHHEGVWYEIYWLSLYAEHVMDNYPKSTHGVKHTVINRLLKRAGYVESLAHKRDYLHVFVTEYEGKIYETYAFLLPQTEHRPAQCVVLTSYKSGQLKRKLPTYQ